MILLVTEGLVIVMEGAYGENAIMIVFLELSVELFLSLLLPLLLASSKVTNISSQMVDRRLVFTWMPPDDPAGVIIHYRVIVTSTTLTTTHNVSTNANLSVSIDEFLFHTNYTITIIPVNGAGEGENDSLTVLTIQGG